MGQLVSGGKDSDFSKRDTVKSCTGDAVGSDEDALPLAVDGA